MGLTQNKRPSDPLLSPEVAAGILGIKEATLANWRCNKRYNLPYVKIGKKVKYPESGIFAFIESRTVEV